MRLRHFEAIGPVCAVCRQAAIESPLAVGSVAREAAGAGGADILEGILQCTRAGCQREYPIIDGIPLLIPALRAYVTQNLQPLLRRHDLSAGIESLLGDCCGPGSVFEQTRQHLSSYVWGHYSDADPLEPPGARLSLLGLLDRGLSLSGEVKDGPILDAGCSVGRSSFELAERCDRLVLGVDLNFSMLQVAGRALRAGEVRYGRRRVGLVYDERAFPVRLARPENVDFWACDAMSLPFPAGRFALATSLNLLDCLESPYEHLASLARVLAVGGRAVLCTPYDWSPGATPIEGWLGGHSQRGPEGGSSAAVLRALLTPGAHPASLGELGLVAEDDGLSFRVRLHDRSTVEYGVHMVVAERRQS